MCAAYAALVILFCRSISFSEKVKIIYGTEALASFLSMMKPIMKYIKPPVLAKWHCSDVIRPTSDDVMRLYASL